VKNVKRDDLIEIEGDTWKVIGIGFTNEEGKTYLHLASTTRFRQQRNGKVPVQMADWL
jgi:hypothetical protein